MKVKFAGQLKEEPLVETRGDVLYFESLVDAYITNLYTLRGLPSFTKFINQSVYDVVQFKDNILFLTVSGLYLFPDTLITDNIAPLPLSYTNISDTLYLSNGAKLYKYDSPLFSEVPFGDIDETYMYIPAGFPIEHDKGRLLSVVGNHLYFSNLWEYEIVDERTNLFQMDSRIVTLCSTPSGLIIGTENGYYFYNYGAEFMAGTLTKLSSLKARSINYIYYNDTYFFMSNKGLISFKGGEFKNVTNNKHDEIENLCKLFFIKLPYSETILVSYLP